MTEIRYYVSSFPLLSVVAFVLLLSFVFLIARYVFSPIISHLLKGGTTNLSSG